MADLDFERSTSGPPTGLSRRGRWAEAHFQVQASNPGEWVVFKGLSRKDASSLRTALTPKIEKAVSRQQEDQTVHVWALRCSAENGHKDATIKPDGIATSTSSAVQ